MEWLIESSIGIYVLGLLNRTYEMSCILFIFGGTVLVLFSVFTALEWDCTVDNTNAKRLRYIKKATTIVAICGGLMIFIPSEKSIYKMYIIPKIAKGINLEELPADIKKYIDLLVEEK